MVLACHVMSQDHVIDGHVTLYVATRQGGLLSCQVRWS